MNSRPMWSRASPLTRAWRTSSSPPERLCDGREAIRLGNGFVFFLAEGSPRFLRQASTFFLSLALVSIASQAVRGLQGGDG
ncbi:hypothetical protein BHE74_00055008 [Ensete ventricosum]|nr:hypothetical protein BHE74_00055008 [Ensete ventricosum]